MKRIFLLLLPLAVACSKEKEPDNYSSYYPDLMELKIIRDFPHMGGPRASEMEIQMELVNGVLYILDRGNGVHAQFANNNKRFAFCISPGASYMVPGSKGVKVDRTVDLAFFGERSIQSTVYLGDSLNVLDELQPPDGKEIPPIFQRENRIKNTEIIRWEN